MNNKFDTLGYLSDLPGNPSWVMIHLQYFQRKIARGTFVPCRRGPYMCYMVTVPSGRTVARITLTVSEEKKAQFAKLAEKEDRFLSRQVLFMVWEYMREHYPEKRPVETKRVKKVDLPANWQIIDGNKAP